MSKAKKGCKAFNEYGVEGIEVIAESPERAVSVLDTYALKERGVGLTDIAKITLLKVFGDRAKGQEGKNKRFVVVTSDGSFERMLDNPPAVH